jgi:hypothetical protein
MHGSELLLHCNNNVITMHDPPVSAAAMRPMQVSMRGLHAGRLARQKKPISGPPETGAHFASFN